MTYDLWEATISGDEFVGVFNSLDEAKAEGDVRHKALDGMPRASVRVEWVDGGADHAVKRYSDSEAWEAA